ncbi:MAG: glycosyltransferase family 39 protein [Anaerolineae bacterium]|nr:glycosyltransferase family 39 protein [Anaerolineae bacterium]
MNADRRTRTLTSLLLSIVALILGLVAQGYFADPVETHAAKPTDGLIVWAIAVLVGALAVARAPRLPPLPFAERAASNPQDSSISPSSTSSVRSRRLVWAAALFSLSGLLIVLSLFLFGGEAVGSGKWVLYLAAIGLFLLGAYALSPFSWIDLRLSSAEWVWLLLILTVAAFFRFYHFGEVPFGLWYDEADNGLWARQLLNDPTLRPIYAESTNLPAHFMYLIMFSFKLFGDGMWSIRLVAIFFGLLTVIAAYFCGRELFDPQRAGRAMGLILACLVAVSRWDVNWSRIGMHGVTVPFFELWAAAALLRGLRTSRLSAFAWSGVALGLGLCFYSPLRVFPAVVGGFLLLWLAQRLWQMQCSYPAWTWGKKAAHALFTWGLPVTLLLIGMLIAVAPVAQFARKQPERFWARADKVSVFQEPAAQADPLGVVGRSALRHLLMFNYEGDPNGRHNLPGAPMLDRLSGVLLVLGVVVAVVHWRDPRALLLGLWLLLPLSGGILTVSFESPQSLRSIGALPAAYGLACMAVAWFAQEWGRVFGSHAVRRLVVVAVVLLAGIGILECWSYFGLWAHDFASWAAFNPAETHMAQDINAYRDRYDLWFDPLLTAHLATRYLAPDYTHYQHFDPATVFPIPSTSREGVLLFISPDTFKVRDDAMSLYSGVRVETFEHEGSGRAVMYKYIFDRDLIASVQGLDASFISLKSGEPEVIYRVDPVIDFDWQSQGSDAPPPVSYPFQAIWSGGLLVPQYGAYTLHIDAPGEVLLILDGQTVFNGTGPQSRRIMLAQGVHAFYFDCKVAGPGALRLRWTVPWDKAELQTINAVPAGALYRVTWPTNGLVGRFYAGGDLTSEPAIVRIDRQLAYYFHFLPLPRPYRVEWTGRLLTPMPGVYRLGVKAISAAALYVDGHLVIESQSGQQESASLELAAGMHDVRVSFLDDRDRSQIYLYWQFPGDTGLTLVPPEALFLPQADGIVQGSWWDAQ